MKRTSIFFALCFLLSCTGQKTEPDWRCTEWTQKEEITTECTRQPYRICVDTPYIKMVCLRREELA